MDPSQGHHLFHVCEQSLKGPSVPLSASEPTHGDSRRLGGGWRPQPAVHSAGKRQPTSLSPQPHPPCCGCDHPTPSPDRLPSPTRSLPRGARLPAPALTSGLMTLSPACTLLPPTPFPSQPGLKAQGCPQMETLHQSGAITAAVRPPPASPLKAFISQDLPRQELSITPLNLLLFCPSHPPKCTPRSFSNPTWAPNHNKNNNNENNNGNCHLFGI